MTDPQPERPRGAGEQISDEIGRKADRKLKARGERHRGVWFGLGMFGLVGWAVAIPTLLGILAGLWLDDRFPGRVSWTLTLLFLGIALGCLNAWYWVKRESQHDR
jgi:ATP synthase protein I